MNIQVACADETSMEQYTFRFEASSLTLHFVRFETFAREKETEDWQETGHWGFPDLFHKSTLPEPERLPDWAIADAKTRIVSQIQVKA
jgi:hypothetical protein